MKLRRTSNPDISFAETDPVWRWAYGMVEFRIDTRKGKFLMTPITWDGSETGPTFDATAIHEKWLRERDGGEKV